MRVLIVAPYARWLPHWETDLEIAQRHLDAGDQVTLLVCNRDLVACDPNPDHGYLRCLHCTRRQREGLRLLAGSFTVEPMIRGEAGHGRDAWPDSALPATLEELRNITIDNFDLGWASLSSLVSWTRDPDPDLGVPAVRSLLRRALESGLLAYRSLRERLRQGDFDLAYVFNGRTAVTRAVVRACEAENVRYRTHDRGCDFNHFELYENRLPHELRGTLSAIRAAWASGIEPDRTQLGEKFYEDRRRGIGHSWVPYTGRQAGGMLPEGWDPTRGNIVVFASSDDELVAIGEEWVNPVYRSQSAGLERILSILGSAGGHRVYIRMHPNQAGNRSAAARRLRSLSAANVCVIAPESRVSSYALLDAAAKVLSFGSTMGIEAAFWGKPSIVVGRSAFEGLGSTYEPSTHEDVIDLLRREGLPPLSRAGALAYGYYELTRGEEFQYFEGTDVWEGRFKGRRISGGRVFNMLTRTKQFFMGMR
jgi:hypothetical protein